MLQRAASNAYSWWWASHIRTKQSKWLNDDLQEMEDRVKKMLKIIDENGDTFAKRAELYFKRRPELTDFVQEAYRAYQGLADRYDHLSGELHRANHTIATAFPDQVQYSMLEEGDGDFPKAITPIDPSKINKPIAEGLLNRKKENQSSVKKTKERKFTSEITKENAQDEINKLQKKILVMQTEKEFIKSTYESGIAKYWEIEKQITEMQEEVCSLQDEFDASAVIEDDEARALMTATALKSCEDAIVRLQEQRKESIEQAKVESTRLKIAQEKLKALQGDDWEPEVEGGETSNLETEIATAVDSIEEEICSLDEEKNELKMICEKVREHFEMNPDTPVVDIAEKIDELVNKVINLDITVSSQTAQIERLRSENNELENNLQNLEEEKVSLINDSNELVNKLKTAQDELNKVQTIEKTVKGEEKTLRRSITAMRRSLSDISYRLQPSKQDDPSNTNIQRQDDSLKQEMEFEVKEVTEIQFTEENSAEKIHVTPDFTNPEESQSQPSSVPYFSTSENEVSENSWEADLDNAVRLNQKSQHCEKEDLVNLHQLVPDVFQDREKALVAEYTAILKSYKQTKKRLSEVERRNEDYLHETMVLIGELKNTIAAKDEEIQWLRQQMATLKINPNANAKSPNEEADELKNEHHEPENLTNATMMTHNLNNPSDMTEDKIPVSVPHQSTLQPADSASDINTDGIEQPRGTSPIAQKVRRDIDSLLEENLEFWLRFAKLFHHTQEFQDKLTNLQTDIAKLKERFVQDASDPSFRDHYVKPESTPVASRLRSLKTELQVWLEQSIMFKSELENRFSSLDRIEKEISQTIKTDSNSEETQLAQYEAAMFQGEVSNMKQENRKVVGELQIGQEHIRELQKEIDKELSKLYDNDGSPLSPLSRSSSKSSRNSTSNSSRHSSSKMRVPLRAFLFADKPKKPSILSCIHPAFHKQYSELRSGFR